MPDEITTLFERLHGSPTPAPFAPPERVRRRGRQRGRRQAMAAGTAVLVVAGLGATWALIRPPSAASRPATSVAVGTTAPVAPPPTGVPVSVMLRPADFAFVGGVEAGEGDDLGPDGPDWPWEANGCSGYDPADYPTLTRRVSARLVVFTAPENWQAFQTVERYPDAAANLADVRRVLRKCPEYRVPDGVDQVFSVAGQGFAGDDALLVEKRFGARVEYHVVVRVGDLVSDLRFPGPSQQTVPLARIMATRLTTAATSSSNSPALLVPTS